MDFPDTDPDGAKWILAEHVIRGDVCHDLMRPRRQDPPTARPVFALHMAGTRYTADGRGWLMAELEPGRYTAAGQPPVPVRVEYPAAGILAWDEAVTKPHRT